MSEDYDYTPNTWSADTSFKSARAAYKHDVVDRSYATARTSGTPKADVLPDEITTDCEAPVLIVCDETGSMGNWPAVIFSKLGYLEHEMRTEYRGEDVETAFLAIGDAQNNETYPLQVRPFVKGGDMVGELKNLIIEGKGGGGMHETYELAALYLSRKFKAPKAIKKPVVIFIGDEKCYPSISPDLARQYCGVELERSLTTEEVFAELRVFCSVYLVLKPYRMSASDARCETNEGIYRAWANLVGEENIAPLPSAERVVDVIFGILAKEAGKIDYFRREIEGRQEVAKVETVYTSLKTIYGSDPTPPLADPDAGKSRIVTALPGVAKKTKRLL